MDSVSMTNYEQRRYDEDCEYRGYHRWADVKMPIREPLPVAPPSSAEKPAEFAPLKYYIPCKYCRAIQLWDGTVFLNPP